MRREVALYAAQRGTALVLAVCVAVHLVTIVYAVRNGLTAAEILSRTRGHSGWATFYGAFVLAVAVHGAIGLRSIASEWLRLRGTASGILAMAFAAAIAAFGLRAVYAVCLA